MKTPAQRLRLVRIVRWLLADSSQALTEEEDQVLAAFIAGEVDKRTLLALLSRIRAK